MIKIVQGLASYIILTKPLSHRGKDPEKIYDLLQSTYPTDKLHCTDSIQDAVQFGLKIANKKDVIVITGSLYLIQEVRDYFSKINEICGLMKRLSRLPSTA